MGSKYKDFFHFIRMLRSVMTLIGLLPIKISLRTLQTSFVFLTVALVTFIKLWNAEQSIFQTDSELSRIVNISSHLVMWIVHVIVLLETSYKMERFDNIILQFENVEKSLFPECYCEAFTSPKLNWRKMQVYTFLFLELIELLLLSWILHLDGITLIRWLFLLYSHITLKVKLIEFVCFVVLTNAMQHDLYSTGTKLMEDLQTTQYNHCSNRRNALLMVNSIGLVRNEIWMAVKMIEDFCEYSLLGVFLRMYCEITFTSYWVYRCFASGYTIPYKIVYILFLLVRGLLLFACCWLCTSCETLENKFISKLSPLGGYKKVHYYSSVIIKDLSLELLHKRIQFSAADIVVINVHSLGEMIFSAMLFVVILIQFQMEGFSN